ncbi:MAG: hypothetical protein KC561_01040 [Myxococcales bacterium]|nr:hypothetical protein [Myxococcales bacterium]
MKRLTTLVCSTLVLISASCNKGPSEEEISEARELITAASSQVESELSQWRQSVREFMDNPIRGTGGCPIEAQRLPRPLFTTRENIDTTLPSTISDIRRNASVALSLLDEEYPILPDERDRRDLSRAQQPEEWGYDLAVLATFYREPEMAGHDVFNPGYATGYVAVWGYRERRFVCSGVYTVENSNTVSGEGVSDLQRNLLSLAIARGLENLTAIP